jgi:hypothetical protein
MAGATHCTQTPAIRVFLFKIMWIAAQTYTMEKLPRALEQKAAHFIVVSTQVANRGS